MNFKNLFTKNREILLPRLVNESSSRSLMQRLAKALASDAVVVLNAEKVCLITDNPNVFTFTIIR
jgi:hypothetical protein